MSKIWRFPHLSDEEMVDFLCRKLALSQDFEYPVGIVKKYSLREHTLSVLEQYKKYKFGVANHPGITQEMFRLLLALHDIGKSNAIHCGNKELQHHYTLKIFLPSQDLLGLTTSEMLIFENLLNADLLGEYFKGNTSLDEAACKIRLGASNSCCSIVDYFKYYLTYYQCDTASYTSSASLISALDFLYVWETKNRIRMLHGSSRRLLFAPRLEKKLHRLQKKLFVLDN